jgi:hypothetical protein
MDLFRTKRSDYRLTFLTSFLLSLIMLAQPIIAVADEGDPPTVGEPQPAPDTGLREPSITGPVVIHGTRPVSPSARHSTNVGNGWSPAPNGGFQQAPLYGSGWNTEYNLNGLSYAPWGQ